VSDPIFVFWGLVAFLCLAAACNHGWHHARDNHLNMRLARVARTDDRTSTHLSESPRYGLDVDTAPPGGRASLVAGRHDQPLGAHPGQPDS
jgi:hypothetical protein